jgi:uncharacterized protein YqgC (DUF456 family)
VGVGGFVDGWSVGVCVGSSVGDIVGLFVLGLFVLGPFDGMCVGEPVDGARVGPNVVGV